MNRSKLDALWHEAEEQSRKEGVMYTRYHFAALVAAAAKAEENEACAKVCDGVQDCGPENGCCPTYWNESLERAAAAIRTRSNT